MRSKRSWLGQIHAWERTDATYCEKHDVRVRGCDGDCDGCVLITPVPTTINQQDE